MEEQKAKITEAKKVITHKKPSKLTKKLNIFSKAFFFLKEKPIWLILIISLLFRLYYVSLNFALWWDTHIYVAMGKYIFTGGKLGFWEIFRPLIHPFIIGAFWKIGLSPIIMGKILDITFSLVGVYLTYLIGKEIFNEKVALMGAIIFSFTPIFITFTGLILTEPLAIMLGLFGIYYVIKYRKLEDESNDNVKKKREKYLFFSGLFLSLSFLTKFPMGIFFGGAGIALFIRNKPWSKKIGESISFFIAFITPIIPYLVFNHYNYGDMFLPFTSGSAIVNTATWLYGNGYLFYFTQFFMKTLLYLFFVPFLYYYFKEKKWKETNVNVILFASILTLIYFMFFVARKEVRYLLFALPFFALMAAYGIDKFYKVLVDKLEISNIARKLLAVIFVALIVVTLPQSFGFDQESSLGPKSQEIVEKYNVTGSFITSHPIFYSYVNLPMPSFAGMAYAEKVYEDEKDNYQLIYINDCDLICAPEDLECEKEKENLINLLIEENKVIGENKIRDCNYKFLINEDYQE